MYLIKKINYQKLLNSYMEVNLYMFFFYDIYVLLIVMLIILKDKRNLFL